MSAPAPSTTTPPPASSAGGLSPAGGTPATPPTTPTTPTPAKKRNWLVTGIGILVLLGVLVSFIAMMFGGEKEVKKAEAGTSSATASPASSSVLAPTPVGGGETINFNGQAVHVPPGGINIMIPIQNNVGGASGATQTITGEGPWAQNYRANPNARPTPATTVP